VYDYRELGADAELIRAGEDHKYCLKQCYKMCYYIQKMHNHEILKMKAEFTKDDNGTVGGPLEFYISLDLVHLCLLDSGLAVQRQGSHAAFSQVDQRDQ